MDFELSWQQQTVVDEIDKLMKKEIEPHVEEYEKNKVLRDHTKIKEIFKLVQPFGAISGPVPEEYGGMDQDYVSVGLVFQKMAEYWASLPVCCVIQITAARVLAEIQNTGLKDKYLRALSSGDLIACQCITEPNVGSNPTELGTTMIKKEDGYRVHGQKVWITNGGVSDVAFVLATADKSLGAKGLGIILVDGRQTPYQTRNLEKLGLRACSTSEVSFEELTVPEENVIIPNGGGLKGIARTFELGRTLITCISVGLSRAALLTAINYAKERVQWGKKIGAHQQIQEMIFNMKARTETSYLLAMRALSMMDKGIRCEGEAALAKAYSTENAVLTTKDCIQIMGGYGYSEEYPAERFYRDATMMTIPDGTTQIQKMIVARDLLGLSAFA